MSSENTALWDFLGRTDPAQTKAFTRGGGFKGTAIKPIWSYRRMTEYFGPCGIGWGIGKPDFQTVPGPEGEMLVYCTASIWYRNGEEASQTVYGVGGDKAVGKNKYGLNSDDEAFKKAFTDAITNALKLIGVGADVHMGLFDDSKYVNSMKAEFADEPAPNVTEIKQKSSAQLKREVDWREVEKEVWDCTTPRQLESVRLHFRERAVKEQWNAAFKASIKELLDKQEADIGEWLETAHEREEAAVKQFPSPKIISTLQAG